MKVKPCINPQRWGARIDLDFPRIYVWDCNDIKGVKCYSGTSHDPRVGLGMLRITKKLLLMKQNCKPAKCCINVL